MIQLIIFILGTVFGSAANALIDRLPRKESWTKGRSHCDKCKHDLAWYDLIPVFSYLTLLGKCRYCHSPIPARNLFVELLMAGGFVLLSRQLSMDSFLLMAILWVTVIIAVMDWETKLVSEVMVVIWGALVIIEKFTTSLPAWQVNNLQFTSNLVGLVIAVGLIGGIWAISKGRAMGFGDVEIAAVMGFWLGWPNIITALEVAFVSGAIVGVIQVVRHKNKMKGQIAFGTFLVLGTWIAYLWGDKILSRIYG